MQRRKFLVGMGSLAAGGAAAMGTGAFESFQATRAMSVDVVGGANSYLGIHPNTDSTYVEESSPIEIDLEQASGSGGSGVPNDGTTAIWPAFDMVNQSSETLYIEAYNPLADSDLTDGGVDVQFIAVDDPDDWFTKSNVPVLFDRKNNVTTTISEDGWNPSSDNPAGIPKIEGSNTDIRLIGAASRKTPQYIELGSGEDVSVIVRVVANDAEPPVELGGDVEIEAYDSEDPMTLPGPAGHLGD